MANGLIDFGSVRPNAAMEAYQQGQQNQLAQMQLAQQQQAIQDAEAERQAWKGAANYGEVQQRLMSQGLGKQALAVGAAQAKQQADKIALLKDTTALMKTTATQIMADPTIAEAALVQFGKQTGHDITNDLAQLRALGGDPDKTRLWAASHALEADKLLPKFQHFDTGGGVQLGTTNPVTGAFTAGTTVKKTATPGELMVDARARERLAAEQATGTLTPESLDIAAEIYRQTGNMPISGIGKGAANLRTQIMNRATELAKGSGATPADAAAKLVAAKQDVGAQSKAIKDFSTGKQGDAVRSFNTAIDHLDTMSKLATALENRDTRLFNTVGNAFAAATGQAAPTDFDTAKAIVGGEVAKALTGANMALKDREEIRDSISRANSPAQLAGSVRRLQELMGGQLNSLNLQYEQSTGRKDFGAKLTPRAKEVVKELRGEQAPAMTAPPPAAIQYLQANPAMAAAFDEKYGKGAAKRALGQ